MKIDGKIAELILRTQNASDGGKHFGCFYGSTRGIRDNCAGYPQKDLFMVKAIELIAKNHKVCHWKYSVTRTRDDYGYGCWIVYFQTRINGEKVQISFHTFNSTIDRYVKNSHRIKWDHGCSRDSAVTAYEYYTCGNYSEGY